MLPFLAINLVKNELSVFFEGVPWAGLLTAVTDKVPCNTSHSQLWQTKYPATHVTFRAMTDKVPCNTSHIHSHDRQSTLQHITHSQPWQTKYPATHVTFRAMTKYPVTHHIQSHDKVPCNTSHSEPWQTKYPATHVTFRAMTDKVSCNASHSEPWQSTL